MKLKRIFILGLLTLSAVGVIVSGTMYKKKQQENLQKSSVIHSGGEKNESINKDSSATSEEQLGKYKDSLATLSVYEYLEYQELLTEENPLVVLYGDVEENQSWSSVLEEKISNELEKEPSFEYISFPEMDTYELYVQRTTTEFEEKNPDVILFRPSPSADRVRDIGLSETKEYTTHLINDLKERFPDAMLVLVESPLNPSLEGVRNSRSLTYIQYTESMNEVAIEQNVPVLFVQDSMNEDETEMSTLYNGEGQLNEKGNEWYANLLFEEMNKEN